MSGKKAAQSFKRVSSTHQGRASQRHAAAVPTGPRVPRRRGSWPADSWPKSLMLGAPIRRIMLVFVRAPDSCKAPYVNLWEEYGKLPTSEPVLASTAYAYYWLLIGGWGISKGIWVGLSYGPTPPKNYLQGAPLIVLS